MLYDYIFSLGKERENYDLVMMSLSKTLEKE